MASQGYAKNGNTRARPRWAVGYSKAKLKREPSRSEGRVLELNSGDWLLRIVLSGLILILGPSWFVHKEPLNVYDRAPSQTIIREIGWQGDPRQWQIDHELVNERTGARI